MSKDPFGALEKKTGLRWVWNLLPANKQDASKIVLPISCLYTPLKEFDNLKVLKYAPITCKNCRTILNPYSRVDYNSKSWLCPMCLQHNGLPRTYHGITPKRKPAELYPQHTTVEYVIPSKRKRNPFFIFLVDTCVSKDKLQIIQENILKALEEIPENSYVGLITFGATVQLYELGYSECSKAFVFRGDKAPTLENFQAQIGLSQKNSQQENKKMYVKSKFVVQLSKNKENIIEIIKELRVDPWPVSQNNRDRRCTGIGLKIASYLSGTGFVGEGGHIVTFVGGPCTSGEGTIVGISKKEHIRLHNDIQSDSAKHFKAATKFYQGISKDLIKNGHSCDIFAANLDEVGLLEMKSCCQSTGGVLLMVDEFKNPIFGKTFERFFAKTENGELRLKFNGTLEVQCSGGHKICGAIGGLASMNQKSARVSDTEIGYGNTNAWKINSVDGNSTVAFFFESIKQESAQGSGGMEQAQVSYFQFVTSYQLGSGETRLRVTTTALKSVGSKRFDQIGKGFDQQAAAVIMGRLAIFKAETDYLYDVLRWLDRSLIRLIRRFGTYNPNQPESLRLPPNCSLFPQFMFHLRRGHFLRVFNSSPDETCFYRFFLNRQPLKDSIIMIQPFVLKYSFDKPPSVVNLDSNMLQRKVILLLDCYDTVLIYYGAQISEWIESGFHKQPKYKSLAKLIKLPEIQAKKIIANRFPYPSYIVCEEGSSQARIILSKVNPSNTHKTNAYGGDNSVKILTDDSSLEFFMKHLKQLVVVNK